RRRWHEEWIDKVVLPTLGGLTRAQRDLARKILLKKRDIKIAGHRPRKWDADRKLELLTDYELLRKEGLKSAEAHGVLQDAYGTWEGAGYWDDDYSPYSYFEGDRVVSSLCIYTMHALVNGRACKVAQVSGVGTLAEYRRRGLNRQLHEIALAKALAEHRFAFL